MRHPFILSYLSHLASKRDSGYGDRMGGDRKPQLFFYARFLYQTILTPTSIRTSHRSQRLLESFFDIIDGMKIKNWKKYLLILAGVYGVWIVVSIVLLYITTGYYGKLIGKTYPDNYYPLEDWDYPLDAKADFDGDGKIDQITSGGCAHFGITDGVPNGEVCQPYYSNESKVVNSLGEYPIHSYMIKENNQWYIIVLDQGYNLTRYAIQKNGVIEKLPSTFEDKKNEAIYLAPFAPFWFFALL